MDSSSLYEIIYEEDIQFVDEQMYNDFLTYCEWFLFDGDPSTIETIPDDVCLYFHDLANQFVEPNLMSRIQSV